MQAERGYRKIWSTVVEFSLAMADYIENLHHNTRSRPALDMLTPTEHETINTTQLQLT